MSTSPGFCGEDAIREDERQACWEDFIQVLKSYGHGGGAVTILLRRMREIGWKDLGTGDGKPLHRMKDSEVRRWLANQGSRKAR
jgi:hypothetical protein